ncbi:hypothetical protein HGM15179_018317 [Zosterops borbonicus]|uniref:ribonuclease H n=1 Tax=Zosterops borbonicus TaxID=364589 RepID=A0A8K1FZ88_9PASS|nr:hypothetical protein HGM15179_018317 [Zosterops borbonicus]
MTKKRLQIAEQLIQEQLDAGHIQPSVSPWNTPIFIIPKKSDKWRLLHDLRKVNEQMQAMDALQPGLPAPSMIPQRWNIVVINLKDCFLTILFHPHDTQHFAFTVPSINRAAPTKLYEWTVLPQSMWNSPTMCQLFVDWALRPIRQHFSNATIYHYMDDILIATKQPLAEANLNWLVSQLKNHGLTVAPEKIQQSTPWKYLDWLITDAQIRPQKITLPANISTLHDAQRLFGDLQWVCTIVGITNDDLQPFVPWLQGSDANSPRICTPAQQNALVQVSEKLQHGWRACCVEHLPLSLFLSNVDACPLAIVFQWQKKKEETQSDPVWLSSNFT